MRLKNRFQAFMIIFAIFLITNSGCINRAATEEDFGQYYLQIIVTFISEGNNQLGSVSYRKNVEYNLGWTASSDGYHSPMVIDVPSLPSDLAGTAKELRVVSDFVKSSRNAMYIDWYPADDQIGKKFALFYLERKGSDWFNSKHSKALITDGREDGFKLNRIGLVLFKNRDSIPEK